MRKTWVDIFSDNLLNNLKIRMMEKINDDLDSGLSSEI